MRKDLIDILREESESEHVAFTEFALVYKKDANILYCFFEGSDDKKYYGLRIIHIAERDFKDFTCGGKDAVIKAFKLVKSKEQYKKAETLFFVDKDYGEIVPDGAIYTTPCYSVENFYTSTHVFVSILKNEFNIKEHDRDFEVALELYGKLQSLFHKRLILFNSWLLCQYEIRRRDGINTYLRIDDAIDNIFRKIVNDDLSGISDFRELNDINCIENDLFPDAPKVDTEVLKEKIDYFKESNMQKLFRGKFEMKFFISFLQKLKNDICKKSPTMFSQRYKCNLRFEYCNALSLLTQYADTPECLKSYLKRFKIGSHDRTGHITRRCTGLATPLRSIGSQ